MICLTGCTKTQSVNFGKRNIISLKTDNIANAIEPIEIELTDDDIKEEVNYKLIQYAEIKKLGNVPIKKGDIVYTLISLYNNKKEPLQDYMNLDIDFIIGDNDFDTKIEQELLGKKIGDKINLVSIKGTIFEEYADAEYYDLEIKNAEEYIYPELTIDFLEKNFNVSSKEDFYKPVQQEAESALYEVELNKIEDKLVENLLEECTFSKEFDQLVQERYTNLMDKYEEYGNLYNMSIEEVLSSFELDREQVQKNAWKFQGEWELVKYYLETGEIYLTSKELKAKEVAYATENGYASVAELIEDSGEQYLLEEIYTKEMKDYLYEKYVGEIERYED